MPFVAVAIGGAVGALTRFSVYRTVETEFPWATFIVNIVGCCLASFLMFRWGVDAEGPLKTLVFTGFFGAFTTMSTFSIDTVNLLAEKLFGQTCANILMNSVLCVGGAVAGRWLALLRCEGYEHRHMPVFEISAGTDDEGIHEFGITSTLPSQKRLENLFQTHDPGITFRR